MLDRILMAAIAASVAALPACGGDDDIVCEDLAFQGDHIGAGVDDLTGYSEVRGDLRILQVDDLSVLQCLTRVAGDLTIIDNPQLADLTGLEALDEIVGAMFIQNNPALTALDGLELSVFGTAPDGNDVVSIAIDDNDMLTSILALNRVGTLPGGLVITSNDALTDLSGLGNVTAIGDVLAIQNNAALVDISALISLRDLDGDLLIEANPSLPTCAAEALRDQLVAEGFAGSVSISGNDDTGVCN